MHIFLDFNTLKQYNCVKDANSQNKGENVAKCENIFCIYQENGFCNNENEPNIDWRGFCKNMIPVRVTRHKLSTEKMITQFKMRDGKHYFNKDNGLVTMTDETIAFFESEFKLD